MVLWSRVLNRRGGLTFTTELRRHFAAKIIQNWWLNIKQKRNLLQHDRIRPPIINR